jgi:hypothetical protein
MEEKKSETELEETLGQWINSVNHWVVN